MKLYHKQKDGCIGHGGQEYQVVDGAVDVPDHAVALLTESFGFSAAPLEAEEADDAPANETPKQRKARLAKEKEDADALAELEAEEAAKKAANA